MLNVIVLSLSVFFSNIRQINHRIEDMANKINIIANSEDDPEIILENLKPMLQLIKKDIVELKDSLTWYDLDVF